MASELGHPSRVEITPDQDPAEDPAVLVASALDAAELRPSLLIEPSPKTKKVRQQRINHYQAWCAANGYQAGLEHISQSVVEAYIRAQCVSRELRPNTLLQALYALAAASERVTGEAVDIRKAREMVRLSQSVAPFEPAYKLGYKPKRPRRSRRRPEAG